MTDSEGCASGEYKFFALAIDADHIVSWHERGPWGKQIMKEGRSRFDYRRFCALSSAAFGTAKRIEKQGGPHGGEPWGDKGGPCIGRGPTSDLEKN